MANKKTIMKKTSIFIILIISSYFTFSQPTEVYEQEFEIINFKIIPPTTISQKSVITFSFDLEMKHPFEDYYLYAYKISPVLIFEDKNVHSDINNFLKVYAKPNYDNENIAYETNMKLTIPYDKIDLEAGEYKIKLEFQAKNDYHDYGTIFTKNLNIIMPELFDYNEQTFSVSNFSITNNFKKFNLRGINISFNTNFKFYSHQIKGVYDNPELEDYYFYIELYNEHSVIKYNFYENKQNFCKQTVTKLAENISFFIPYFAINMPKGEHSL